MQLYIVSTVDCVKTMIKLIALLDCEVACIAVIYVPIRLHKYTQ